MTLSYKHCDVASIHRWWLMCQSCNTCCRVDTLPPWLPGPFWHIRLRHPLMSPHQMYLQVCTAGTSLKCNHFFWCCASHFSFFVFLISSHDPLRHCTVCHDQHQLPTTGCGGRNQDQVATCRTAYYQPLHSAWVVLRWNYSGGGKQISKEQWKKKKLMTCSEINGKSTTLRGHNALASSAIKFQTIWKILRLPFFLFCSYFMLCFFFKKNQDWREWVQKMYEHGWV